MFGPALLDPAFFQEILGEPLPFLQWGMEAIGSGICEPLKAAEAQVKQVAINAMMELAKFVAEMLVDAFMFPIEGVTMGIADAFDDAADELRKWLGPLLEPIDKAIKEWLGDLFDWVKDIPPWIMNILKEIGDTAYEWVTESISPDLKIVLDNLFQIWRLFKDEFCEFFEYDCGIVMLQMQQTSSWTHADIKDQLMQGKVQQLEIEGKLWKSGKVKYPTFEQHMKYNNRGNETLWVRTVKHWHRVRNHAPARGETTLVSILHSSRANDQEFHARMAKRGWKSSSHWERRGVSAQQYRQVLELKNGKTAVHRRLAEFQKRFDAMRDRMPASPHRAELAVHTTTATTFVQSANVYLDIDEWWKRVEAFWAEWGPLLECLWKTATQKWDSMVSVLANPSGDFGEFLDSLGKKFELFMAKAFDAFQKTADQALGQLNTGPSGNLLEPGSLSKIIIMGLKNFAKLEPAIECFIPLVKIGLEEFETVETDMVNDMNHFFDEFIMKGASKVSSMTRVG